MKRPSYHGLTTKKKRPVSQFIYVLAGPSLLGVGAPLPLALGVGAGAPAPPDPASAGAAMVSVTLWLLFGSCGRIIWGYPMV